MRRLENTYRHEPHSLKQIVDTVNNIAQPNNWSGAFAELAVYDHLNHGSLPERSMVDPISLDVTLGMSASFTTALGGKPTNVDGLIKEFGVYFDIKCLKDNVTEILEVSTMNLSSALVFNFASKQNTTNTSLLRRLRKIEISFVKNYSTKLPCKCDQQPFRARSLRSYRIEYYGVVASCPLKM